MRAFVRRKDGSVAIEYVVLAPLFFVMALGAIEVALINIGVTGVRAGMSDIGRDIRTGEAQCLTEVEIVEAACRYSLVPYCSSDMSVEQSVVSGGATTTVASVDGLDAGDIVVLRATYPWRVINPILEPYFADENGAVEIGANVVFRSESFDDQIC
ncbi:MAG: TadE/TadG family type IV pilus assembly protein [Pseudomonadota bacterium]